MRRRFRSGRGVVGRVIVASLIVAVGVVGDAPLPVVAASGWRIVASPNVVQSPSARLAGIACPSTSRCFAVGSTNGVNFLQPSSQIEQWDGTAWSAMPSPDPAGAIDAELNAVACASDTDCFAVGWAGSERGILGGTSLVKRWDGTTWSVVAVPNSLGTLEGIACPSATSCFAIGGNAGALRWDGAAWSLLSSPAAGFDSALKGIACSSASNCFAVGVNGAEPNQTLIEHWDGTTWTIVPSPTPTGASSPELLGVACPSASVCFAVGASDGSPLVERWDGTAWSLVASPPANVTFPPALESVVCSDVSDCFAVGGGSSVSTTIHWDGTKWSTVPSPAGGSLTAVACTSAADCSAVGTYGFEPMLAQHWNGTTWSIVAIPTPVPPYDVLAAVTCRNSGDCWAVGHFDLREADFDNGLIEHWNGTSWAVVPDGHTASDQHLQRLVGVACQSANRCFAVGDENYQDFEHTLVMHNWNGNHWTQVIPRTPVGSRRNGLSGVACVATTCFAVGYYQVDGRYGSLVERWDGARWSQVSSPNPKNYRSAPLEAIACSAPSTCIAVGYADVNGSPLSVMAQRWNGHEWSRMSIAGPRGATSSTLSGVACAKASDCVAVGAYASSGRTRPFAERWNGTGWSVSLGLTPGGASAAQLSSVSCVGAANCFAAGNQVVGGVTKPLLEHWNGTAWSPVSAPVPSGVTFSQLSGVACVPASGCFAVGSSAAENFQSTLVERSS